MLNWSGDFFFLGMTVCLVESNMLYGGSAVKARLIIWLFPLTVQLPVLASKPGSFVRCISDVHRTASLVHYHVKACNICNKWTEWMKNEWGRENVMAWKIILQLPIPHLSVCWLQLNVLSTADLQLPLSCTHIHSSGSLHGQGTCWRLQPDKAKNI